MTVAEGIYCGLYYISRRSLSGLPLARLLQNHVMILQVMAVLLRPTETAIKLSRSESSPGGMHRHNKKADVQYLREGRVPPWDTLSALFHIPLHQLVNQAIYDLSCEMI